MQRYYGIFKQAVLSDSASSGGGVGCVATDLPSFRSWTGETGGHEECDGGCVDVDRISTIGNRVWGGSQERLSFDLVASALRRPHLQPHVPAHMPKIGTRWASKACERRTGETARTPTAGQPDVERGCSSIGHTSVVYTQCSALGSQASIIKNDALETSP